VAEMGVARRKNLEVFGCGWLKEFELAEWIVFL
jgi:hypothetical protein